MGFRRDLFGQARRSRFVFGAKGRKCDGYDAHSIRSAVLNSLRQFTAPMLLVLAGLSVNAQSADANYRMDYAPIMTRGFGVLGEPSLLDQCGSGYEGFRIFEYAARPMAILRVERIDGIAVLTKRTFNISRTGESAQERLSASAWTELTGLVEESGFWEYQLAGLWVPDARTMWVEACMDGQFRSISFYPDREDLMADVIEHLLAHVP